MDPLTMSNPVTWGGLIGGAVALIYFVMKVDKYFRDRKKESFESTKEELRAIVKAEFKTYSTEMDMKLEKFKIEVRNTEKEARQGMLKDIENADKKAEQAKKEASESKNQTSHLATRIEQYIKSQEKIQEIREKNDNERHKALQTQVNEIPKQVIEQLTPLISIVK